MPILGIIASSFRSAAGPQGAYDALATITVPSGGVASVSFVGIPSGYKHLQIRAIIRSNAGMSIDAVRINFNGDTGSNYIRHALYGDGSSANSIASAASSTFASFGDAPAASSSSNVFGAYPVDVLDYANVSKYKTLRAVSGYDLNGSGEINLRSNLWMSTAAITSINIVTGSGSNISQYSQFALYGVK